MEDFTLLVKNANKISIMTTTKNNIKTIKKVKLAPQLNPYGFFYTEDNNLLILEGNELMIHTEEDNDFENLIDFSGDCQGNFLYDRNGDFLYLISREVRSTISRYSIQDNILLEKPFVFPDAKDLSLRLDISGLVVSSSDKEQVYDEDLNLLYTSDHVTAARIGPIEIIRNPDDEKYTVCNGDKILYSCFGELVGNNLYETDSSGKILHQVRFYGPNTIFEENSHEILIHDKLAATNSVNPDPNLLKMVTKIPDEGKIVFFRETDC